MEHEFRRIVCTQCGYSFDIPIACGNRFCDTCTSLRRYRIREKMKSLMKLVHPRKGQTIKFLTLTIPNCKDPRYQLDLLIKSFRKLRQRKYYRSKIEAGASFFEVTGRPGAWHVHLHAIILSDFIPVERLATDWAAVSPGQIVHIKRIPLGAAVAYLTAYAMKSDLPERDQMTVSAALKGRRLFQPFGGWHQMMGQIPAAVVTCKACGSSSWAYDGPGGWTDRIVADGSNTCTPWMNRPP